MVVGLKVLYSRFGLGAEYPVGDRRGKKKPVMYKAVLHRFNVRSLIAQL